MKGGLLAIRSLQDLQMPDGTLTEEGVCLAAFVVSAIFTTICYKGSRYVSPLLFPVYKTFKLHDQRDWDTRYSSYVHSVLIVYYAYRAIMVSDLYYRTDLPTPSILRTSHETYGALGMSLGYFVVDLAATLKYMMGGPEMALHHVGSFASVGMAIATGNCHLYTLWMLITEATTPFINLRWSLDKAGLKTSTWYLYNGIAILLSWILFRLAAFPPFFIFLWGHRAELRYIAHLSSFLLITFPLILFGLNLFWFTKIVKGALKLLSPRKAKGTAAKEE